MRFDFFAAALVAMTGPASAIRLQESIVTEKVPHMTA